MIRNLSLLAIRLAVGGGIAAHGAQKRFGWYEGPGPEGAAKMMHSLGFRPGEQFAQTASGTEIASGLLIAAGLGGPVGPAMLISTMVVAQRSVHWKNGFFAQKGGIELGVMYSAAALALAVDGYGDISLDRLFGLHDKLRNPLLTTLALAAAAGSAWVILNGRDFTPDGPATPTFRGKNSPIEPDVIPPVSAQS